MANYLSLGVEGGVVVTPAMGLTRANRFFSMLVRHYMQPRSIRYLWDVHTRLAVYRPTNQVVAEIERYALANRTWKSGWGWASNPLWYRGKILSVQASQNPNPPYTPPTFGGWALRTPPIVTIEGVLFDSAPEIWQKVIDATAREYGGQATPLPVLDRDGVWAHVNAAVMKRNQEYYRHIERETRWAAHDPLTAAYRTIDDAVQSSPLPGMIREGEFIAEGIIEGTAQTAEDIKEGAEAALDWASKMAVPLMIVGGVVLLVFLKMKT